MTYQEFKNKWNNQYCEIAGSSNAINQCTDCANAYIRDVLGLPIIEHTNAQDFPKKCLPPKYEYIKNSPSDFPLQGDIVIWTSPDRIGHISICDRADIKSLDCFGQNWPVGSNCHIQHHTYTTASKLNVDGWLRCKIDMVTNSDNMTDEQKRILDFIGTRTEGDVRQAFGALTDSPAKDKQIQTLQSKVLDLEKSQKDLSDRLTALESNIQADLNLITDWQQKAETANKQLENANKSNQELITEKNKYKGWYETKCDQTIDKLDTKIILDELFIRFKKLWKK